MKCLSGFHRISDRVVLPQFATSKRFIRSSGPCHQFHILVGFLREYQSDLIVHDHKPTTQVRPDFRKIPIGERLRAEHEHDDSRPSGASHAVARMDFFAGAIVCVRAGYPALLLLLEVTSLNNH